ncbi:hypothetical protein VOLCADRAFT_82699 [Volvox carteri f. nagariensis]|uniref:Prostaglandin E synthase 2 n=1 Tax=Volvox carteri f. nagariensis TaxID=3068 RepID=D8U6G0_VOLCA|nr:uncharacterized protein VOLCADRAFT_82699 [Volvox carteri f. nagariensis]EFJ44640.1 hypothetical protein VOLCADRAFT_82699 [Volvox carteri f. nagariensis]|eukprot:XP_002954216.1 hypothetical protein VOLCADRAFT_82699 [Volvox carteri f. nagariensis]
MSSAGALRRLPLLLLAQGQRANTIAHIAASSRLSFTGINDQRYGDSHRHRPGILLAAASLLGIGAAATVTTASADAPTPIEVASDPYARPAEAHPLPSKITLYQYEVCPYCCKVRAFLDYYKLPYTVIEVNPLTKGELKWSSYKKVPVVKLDEEVVVDSSAIMSRLAKDNPPTVVPPPPPLPSSSSSSLEEEVLWRKWVDEKLVKVLTANIYRNWDESVETFKYITEQTGWSWGAREVARWAGAVMMWQVGKRMPAKYGIEGDLRMALYDVANDFADNALRGRRFAGGDVAPNLADLAAFGVIRAVRQTGAFRDMMANTRLAPWYAAMEGMVGESARINPGQGKPAVAA